MTLEWGRNNCMSAPAECSFVNRFACPCYVGSIHNPHTFDRYSWVWIALATQFLKLVIWAQVVVLSCAHSVSCQGQRVWEWDQKTSPEGNWREQNWQQTPCEATQGHWHGHQAIENLDPGAPHVSFPWLWFDLTYDNIIIIISSWESWGCDTFSWRRRQDSEALPAHMTK